MDKGLKGIFSNPSIFSTQKKKQKKGGCQTVIPSSVRLCSAASASLFHIISRRSSNSLALASVSSCCFSHSSNSSKSISKNIFRTFMVRPWTAWFQCDLTFFSNGSKMIGRMTQRFWAIKLTMWSLFHKKKALSATCNANWISKQC